MQTSSFAAALVLVLAGPAFAAPPTGGEGRPAAANVEPLPHCHKAGDIRGVPVKSVQFMDFLPTEASAIEVAASLDERRFDIVARPAADGVGWVVHATYHLLPSLDDVKADYPAMVALGQRFGGRGLLAGCRSHWFPRSLAQGFLSPR